MNNEAVNSREFNYLLNVIQLRTKGVYENKPPDNLYSIVSVFGNFD